MKTTDPVAKAIRELAAATDRQTEYLRQRDEQSRRDWLKARREDQELVNERREQDYQRAVRLRADERAAGIEQAFALAAVRSQRPSDRPPAPPPPPRDREVG